MTHNCKEVDDKSFTDDCPLLMAAYILAGLSMMLNIRLAYSSAPYALIRFRLPENLFSVFVRRMASALELWCLPSMAVGNIVDISMKLVAANNTVNYDSDNKLSGTNDEDNLIKNKWIKFYCIIVPSFITMWSDFIAYVVLLYVYLTGGDQGRVTAYYGVIAVSGFIFGINMTLVYAADWRYIYLYIAGENTFPALTSFIHYLTTLMFGNRRKWNSDFLIVCIDICVAIMISFTTAILWTCAHIVDPEGTAEATNFKDPDGSTTSGQGRLESGTRFSGLTKGKGPQAQQLWHIKPPDKIEDAPYAEIVSPALMVIVGMGLVYAIYPGIAPGMIVPFYLIDKIEMVLLIATIFPPVIVAMLIKFYPDYSPKTKFATTGWRSDGPTFYHAFDLLMVIKITLAVIFIYSLHYRDSSISRAIINQPKMSTTLSITFYMCHEILLALGFPGVVGNKGANYVVLPAQYIGALFMIFLAFYSEGYIIEYKSNDPGHWPTEGMTKWNAFCYWCKRASKITINNLKSLFQRIAKLFTFFIYF